jgi:colanic acid/amylovoran biosynthesis glycosyltransferase
VLAERATPIHPENTSVQCELSTLDVCGTSPANRTDLPGVLIYAPHLLPTGHHYVQEHAARLRRYRPALAGRRRVEGTTIQEFPNFTIGNTSAGIRELRFLLTGRDAALSAFVRHHRIRLIHAHFGPGGVEIMTLAERHRIPLVVTLHGWDVRLGREAEGRNAPYERVYRWRLPRLFRQASAIVCVSESWRERVLKLGCPADKVHTNYLGVDSKFFDGVRGPFDPMSIIFVGRLIPQKGVSSLLGAIRLLRERGVAAHLTVVGEGPELSQLQKIAAADALPVRFVGKSTLEQIREFLRSSAVLCAPSTTQGSKAPEALGLVLLEAQAMGVPVVATRNGGIPETLQDGRTGYLIDQDMVPALAGALEKLLTNESLNRSFGQRARAFVCERFDIERCYRRLEDLYDRIGNRNYA